MDLVKSMELKATERTPSVILNSGKGTLVVVGRSIHEDADEFYSPIQTVIENHLSQAGTSLHATFHLEYFNTSSSKYFLDIMKTMEEAFLTNGSNVSITWRYDADDLDMQEAGQDYAGLLQIPVTVIAGEPS